MTATASAPPANRWLYGPVPDLLLGCGLLYGLLFVVFAFVGPSVRAAQPSYLVPVLILLVSMPHYGGTLVRVYDQRRDRRSYALFSVWATLAIAALFVWGAFATVVASWLFTIYITWSPWHYTGQNYGLAVMFLRRRGVPLSPGVKRLFYASFLLAYLLTFMVFHSAIGIIDYNAREAAETSVSFLPLGIPPAVHGVVFPLLTAAYLATLVASAALLLRRGRVRDLVPAAALVLTQALWFSIPFGVKYYGIQTGLEPVDFFSNQIRDYFAFVAVGHAAQYLWVTSYYARGSDSWRGYPRYFAKVVASGVAIWTLPVIFFAPLVRGHYEYAGGLALLTASTVNIHHFILDGAIWKLRNTKIASVLIRAEPERPAGLPEAITPGRRWLRPLVWGAATAGLAVGAGMVWLGDFVLRSAFLRDDHAAVSRVLDRMAWFGRDSSRSRIVAGRIAARAGEWETALANYESALVLAPAKAELLEEMGRAHLKLGRPEQARELLERALALDPDSARVHLRLATLSNHVGDRAKAAAHLREAVRLAPDAHGARNDLAWTLATSGDPSIREPEEAIRLAESLVREAETTDPNWLDTLAAAYASAGRFDDAVRSASQAAALAQQQGQTELGEQIGARLDLYRERRAFVDAESPGGA
jgi:tetratricopeptide (TPR) repeat protein